MAQKRTTRTLGWVLALGLLGLSVIASLAIGSRTIDPSVVLGALLGTSTHSTDAIVVIDSRLPRTIVGLAAGLSLGLAGGLIQAVTRNPLADPGILGVTSGAAFAVAIAVGVLGITSAQNYVWFAFGGALVATVFVYIVGSAGRSGGSPVRLTLTGVALGAVLAGITSGMLLADPRGFAAMQAWQSGSLQDRGWESLAPVAPFLVVGVVLAFVIARPLNAVALGDDLAASLGANVAVVRVVAVIAVTLLAGGSTAIAGPIAFVGLAVPHIARWIVGPDQRWILAYTLVLAPVLLLLADIVGRVIMPPGEVQAGIITAALGAPVLIYLVRRSKAISL
ncbi:iron chelate uptake ABC transporter family permease subunit [Glaciihabitans sp. dw_435]|uniref:FecCD family ABC transporter permease n=1 Tax=Glaciihabitans sp. dw_435 TaxID=2720081 RepID=UPI0027DB463F|nr:iron chelate uptake ABC transporter family permease subunit [Glaciihabitans sp. dw_435]